MQFIEPLVDSPNPIPVVDPPNPIPVDPPIPVRKPDPPKPKKVSLGDLKNHSQKKH